MFLLWFCHVFPVIFPCVCSESPMCLQQFSHVFAMIFPCVFSDFAMFFQWLSTKYRKKRNATLRRGDDGRSHRKSKKSTCRRHNSLLQKNSNPNLTLDHWFAVIHKYRWSGCWPWSFAGLLLTNRRGDDGRKSRQVKKLRPKLRQEMRPKLSPLQFFKKEQGRLR